MKQKVSLFIKRLLAHIPSPLPVGMDEFNAWAASFLELYDLPTKDLRSIKWILATNLMGVKSSRVSKHHFYKVIMIASTKEIANAVFYIIKTEQLEQAKASEQPSTEVPSEQAS